MPNSSPASTYMLAGFLLGIDLALTFTRDPRLSDARRQRKRFSSVMPWSSWRDAFRRRRWLNKFTSRQSMSHMKRSLEAMLILALAACPLAAGAQGSRGGFGGGGGGRGDRGQRGQGNDSTAATGVPRVQLSFVDMVFARRKDLKLTDSEVTRVGEVRMDALTKRAQLNREVDSVRADMVVTPTDAETPPTDSSRKATMAQRRALAAMLGELHDVDVNARNETLAVLTPDQQKKAEALEEASDSPAPANRGFGGGGGRGGGHPNGGGMGGIGGL